MNIDDIMSGADTIMTSELVRLFKVAGCSPTKCHACGRILKVGMVFKLVAHKEPDAVSTDEMCCSKCGEDQLVLRDKRLARASTPIYRRDIGTPSWGGYSRPSKAKP